MRDVLALAARYLERVLKKNPHFIKMIFPSSGLMAKYYPKAQKISLKKSMGYGQKLLKKFISES